MHKQIFLVTVLVIFIGTCAWAQDFKVQYKDLVAKKDTAGEIKLLRTWRTSQPNDAELYVAFYNYYVNKSIEEVVSIEQTQKGDQSLEITDSSSKKWYMNDNMHFSEHYRDIGFSYIDTGIMKFPARLDMRFGKVYLLGQIQDYDKFTAEIIKTIDYGAVIKDKWMWTDNKPQDDPLKFMLSTVQDYFLQLYNTNDDGQIENMKLIAEAVMKYHPDNVENLSNLSVIYLLRKDYDKALPPLLKAEKLAPHDYIVISNIAQAYKMKGDRTNAIKYYILTEKYGDEQAVKYAHEQIEELQKK